MHLRLVLYKETVEMKKYTLFPIWLFLASFISLTAQTTTLNAHLTDCSEEPGLFIFDGTAFVKTDFTLKSGKENHLEYLFNANKSGFFYFGSNLNSMKLIFLDGTESTIELHGKCETIPESILTGSESHAKFEEFIKRNRELNLKSGRTKAILQRSTTEEEQIEKFKELALINREKKTLIEEANLYSAAISEIVKLNTYLDFIPGTSNHPNELVYFIDEFFAESNLKELTIDNNPFLFEAFRNFTNTLIEIRLQDQILQAKLNEYISSIASSPHIKNMALGGIVSALGQKEHPAFISFAEILIKDLTKINAPSAGLLQQKIAEIGAFMPGGTPPNFSQLSPEGETIQLTQLRGKYLLLDFWASWCGPCRKENPNVVRLYEKYKDKGFEILGISLDNDRNRWLNAISMDKLTWYHVSDLKGWNNEVAKLYGVTSIPKTILLDPEGKIVALNLRAESLENALRQIFD
jgi:thiol-disulfide isomerase/thioredoxin